MRRLTCLCFLCVCCLALACNATSATRLKAISDEMYKEGNEYYILVDALKDGFLKIGEPYSYAYKNGEILFNDTPIREPYKTDYLEKMKQFYALDSIKVIRPVSGTNLAGNDVLDKNGYYRNAVVIRNEQNTVIAAAVDAMYSDGLLHDKKHFRFRLDHSGFYLNNERIADSLAARYISLLAKSKYINPTGHCRNFSFSYQTN